MANISEEDHIMIPPEDPAVSDNPSFLQGHVVIDELGLEIATLPDLKRLYKLENEPHD